MYQILVLILIIRFVKIAECFFFIQFHNKLNRINLIFDGAKAEQIQGNV